MVSGLSEVSLRSLTATQFWAYLVVDLLSATASLRGEADLEAAEGGEEEQPGNGKPSLHPKSPIYIYI